MHGNGYARVLAKVLKWLNDNKDLWENNPERYQTLFESRLRLHALTDYDASNCLAEYQMFSVYGSTPSSLAQSREETVIGFLAA